VSFIEVISADENPFEQKTAGVGFSSTEANDGTTPVVPFAKPDYWCEFCKGWYHEEYHFGDREGGE
jgi:hypothetical protein